MDKPFAQNGIDPMPITPQAFDTLIQKEIAENIALVKAAGIKVQGRARSPARPRDPPTLGASYGGLESAEAPCAKAESGDPVKKTLDSRLRGNERSV